MGDSCNVFTDTFLQSLVYQGALMHTIGILAWATAFIAVRKHEARKQAVQGDGGAAAAAQEKQQTAHLPEAGLSRGLAALKLQSLCQSPRSVHRPEQHLFAARPGSRMLQAAETPLSPCTPCSAGASIQGPAADPDKDLVPFETLGIHLLRTLGLAPALCWLDERAAQIADRIDETVVLRSACLPVAAYSLAYTHLARVQFMVSDGAWI